MSEAKISAAQAAELWNRLLEAFCDAEAAICDIIVTEAWKPLGYKTFSEAWVARMKPSYLASEGLKHAIVWQMFKEGVEETTIACALSNVGARTIATMREKYDAGYPADIAGRIGKPKLQAGNPEKSAPRTIRVDVTPVDYAYFRTLCDVHGTSIAREAEKAVRAHFRRLERQGLSKDAA